MIAFLFYSLEKSGFITSRFFFITVKIMAKLKYADAVDPYVTSMRALPINLIIMGKVHSLQNGMTGQGMKGGF